MLKYKKSYLIVTTNHWRIMKKDTSIYLYCIQAFWRLLVMHCLLTNEYAIEMLFDIVAVNFLKYKVD